MNNTTCAASAALAAALVLTAGAQAQVYPAKPIRMIVPFPAGGATDLMGRLIGQKLGEAFGQQVVVENRGGANGTLGLDIASKAPPDGYNLVIGQTGNLTISVSLMKLGYDPVKDFSPVSQAVSTPNVIVVHPSMPIRTVKDLVALAKAKPGQINYASSGSGSPGHLGLELLKKMANIDMVHIPYKGAAPAMVDVVAGQVTLYFTSPLSAGALVKQGRLRMVAQGGATRAPSLPDLPTIAESGYPGFDVTSWWGVLAPAGVPKDIITRLNLEVVKLMKTPEARDRMAGLGADVVAGTPEQFAELIRVETAKWAKLVRALDIRMD